MIFLTVNLQGFSQLIPDPPNITYVTIDTATGYSQIFWNKSVSEDISWYVLYYDTLTLNGYEGVKFDSVPATENSYIHTDPARLSRGPVIYSVSAVRTSDGYNISPRSARHSTLFNTVKYDSCNNTITLTWNKYNGWGNNISGYRVKQALGSGDYEIIAGVNPKDSSYTLLGVPQNTMFHFIIEAIESSDALISSTDIVSKYTFMPLPPDDFFLDFVSVTGPYTVDLRFRFREPILISDFAILRSNSDISLFDPVKIVSEVISSPWTVSDSIFTAVDTSYFRIAALNSCGIVIDTSNLGSNILLLGRNVGDDNVLEWNPYRDFPTGPARYSVLRYDDSGNDFLLKTLDEVNFNDDELNSLYNQNYSGKIRYRIMAVDITGQDTAWSNFVEISVKSRPFIPNAFTPNGDTKNDIFKPILTFLPDDYLMIIYDRFGIPVYQSNDPETGWDGTINGKAFAPEGVYIYHIQFTSFNGEKTRETGHVTVIYP